MSLGGGDFQLVAVSIVDVTAADNRYVPMPYQGRLLKIMSGVEAATGGSDLTITASIDKAGTATAVTGCVITHTQSGSGAGDVDSAVPTATTKDDAGGYFDAGDSVLLAFGGEATTTGGSCTVTLVIGAQAR